MSGAVQLPDGVRHGTNYAYTKFKCRCEPCVENRRLVRRLWASEAARPVSAPVARLDLPRWPMQALVDAYRGATPLRDALGGVNSDDWKRAHERGLPDAVADRWATRLGLHPAAVWGWAWIDAALTELDRLYLYGSDTAEPGWRQAALYADEAPLEVAA